MSIPDCPPELSILQPELTKLSQQNKVQRMKLIYTAEGSYIKVALKGEPKKEYFLTTRRDRAHPKVFVDQNRLLADLLKSYPSIVFEADAKYLRRPEGQELPDMVFVLDEKMLRRSGRPPRPEPGEDEE